MPLVLLVGDNEEILTANRDYLLGQNFDVECATTGMEALSLIRAKRYGCIVLDILLPDLDGFAICKTARTVTDTPILFLFCLEESDDKVKGLRSGGDDYMVKPYSLKEFGSRIQALMRRGEPKEKPRGDFYIDRDNRLIHTLGKNVFLSEREFTLFELLSGNPDISGKRKNAAGAGRFI